VCVCVCYVLRVLDCPSKHLSEATTGVHRTGLFYSSSIEHPQVYVMFMSHIQRTTGSRQEPQ